MRHEEAQIRCGKSSGCAGGGTIAHSRVVRRGALALGGHARPGTTEYAILVGVLVVIAIIAITLFRPKLQELWDAIASGINSL